MSSSARSGAQRHSPSASRHAGSATPVVQRARSIGRSRLVRVLVRGGFVARAVTYAIVGALALALALGGGHDGAATNQQGALALIASAPLGKLALVAIAVGLLAYALWKLWLSVAGRGPEGGGGRSAMDRIANAAGGIVYLGFFALAVNVLRGTGGSGSSEPRRAAAGVLSWPGGPELVGLGGTVFIVVCLVQAYEGATGKFLDETKCGEMGEDVTQVWVDVMGRVGLVARAAVFAVVGYFLVRAAIDYDPNNAVGLDGALRQVHDQPYGSVLLALVATGLIVFALFSLAEARYRKL